MLYIQRKRIIVYLCWWETAMRVALCNDPPGDRYSSTDVPETRVRQQSICRHLNVERPSTLVRWTPSPRNWPCRVVTVSSMPVLQTTWNEISHCNAKCKLTAWITWRTIDAWHALFYKVLTHNNLPLIWLRQTAQSLETSISMSKYTGTYDLWQCNTMNISSASPVVRTGGGHIAQ